MSVSVRIVAHAYAKLFSKYIAIMKKKIYNQPIVEIAESLKPMAIVCASITKGDPVPDPGTGDPMYGE